MRQSSAVYPDATTRPNVRARVLPAIGVLVATWIVMWRAQSIPTLCALANPCPPEDVRVAPALLFGGLLLVPTVALILTAQTGRSWAWMRTLSYVVLVGLALVGLGAVLFSGGFTVPLV
ncbi:hypothetical protein QE392_002763 [Microbacterium proteolyticum]|nr:hypothetical protein [Microbacterium sp. SORGH_AS_0344]MDQ1170959.1 hypothetical protein [Microbacterium proteolyticum]